GKPATGGCSEEAPHLIGEGGRARSGRGRRLTRARRLRQRRVGRRCFGRLLLCRRCGGGQRRRLVGGLSEAPRRDGGEDQRKSRACQDVVVAKASHKTFSPRCEVLIPRERVRWRWPGSGKTRVAMRNGAIAVGEADSGLKSAADVHSAPLTDHPPPQVRRVAAGGSRLFVAPGGRLVQKGLGQGPRLGRWAFVNGRSK